MYGSHNTDNPSIWLSISEIKKKKETQLDNNLLNDMEAENAEQTSENKQINLENISNDANDSKPSNQQTTQSKKPTVKNWKNEDEEDDNEPLPAIDANQKKNIDVAVLSSAGMNSLN
jgi:hypothetical protein